jgi:hypothetical protein
MSIREDKLQQVVQGVDDIGAANMNVQAAKDWLESEIQEQANAFGEGAEIVGKLKEAAEAAESAVRAIAQAGTELEAFKEALEGLA